MNSTQLASKYEIYVSFSSLIHITTKGSFSIILLLSINFYLGCVWLVSQMESKQSGPVRGATWF
jgi:hypothetical protein